MAVFYGTWWGLGTGLVAFAVRQGVVAEYRTGRRLPAGPRRARAQRDATRWRSRLTAAEQLTAGVLAALVLPLAALAAALDGASWVPVVHCDVNTGQGPHRQRVMELGRQGQGVFGWSTEADEIVTGIHCAGDDSRVIRAPWWRTG